MPVNVEGADVGTGLGKSTLPTLHGFYSLGTLAGAAVGVGITAIDVPIGWDLLVVSVFDVVAVLVVFRRVPLHIGAARCERGGGASPSQPGPPSRLGRPGPWHPRDPGVPARSGATRVCS